MSKKNNISQNFQMQCTQHLYCTSLFALLFSFLFFVERLTDGSQIVFAVSSANIYRRSLKRRSWIRIYCSGSGDSFQSKTNFFAVYSSPGGMVTIFLYYNRE